MARQFNLKAILSAQDGLSPVFKQINRSMRGYRRQLGAIGRATSGVFEQINRIAGPASVVFGAGGLAGLGLGVKAVINTSAEFERMGTVLETIEGSAEKAKASLDWVSEFAAATPYELGEVSEAFVRLKSYGIDPMDGSLRAAGDAAASLGKPVMQAVEALADAMTGQNERLKEFGITASTAGDQITYSWIENGKTVTRTVDKNNKALIESTLTGIWNSKYAGAMDKLSGTWGGMWSNMQDAFTRVLKAIGDAGVFEFLKGQMKGVLDTVNRMATDGSLQAFAQQVSDFLVDAFVELRKLFDAIDWAGVLDGLRSAGRALRDFGESIGGMRTALIAVGAVIAGPLALALAQFSALLLGTPVGAFLASVALIVGAAGMIMGAWNPIERFFPELWDKIVDSIGAGIAAALDMITGLPDRVLAALREALATAASILPDWVREKIGLDEMLGSVSGGAAAAPAPGSLPAARARADVQGDITVRFQDAPPGTRVEPGTTNQRGLSLNPDVGYRSAAWGVAG